MQLCKNFKIYYNITLKRLYSYTYPVIKYKSILFKIHILMYNILYRSIFLAILCSLKTERNLYLKNKIVGYWRTHPLDSKDIGPIDSSRTYKSITSQILLENKNHPINKY